MPTEFMMTVVHLFMTVVHHRSKSTFASTIRWLQTKCMHLYSNELFCLLVLSALFKCLTLFATLHFPSWCSVSLSGIAAIAGALFQCLLSFSFAYAYQLTPACHVMYYDEQFLCSCALKLIP